MEQTVNKENGQFLGYPDCCIKAFGDPAPPSKFRPQVVQNHIFNGFIPCKLHAQALEDKKYTRQDLIEFINFKRICTIPFAEQHTAEEQEEITTQLWQLITKED